MSIKTPKLTPTVSNSPTKPKWECPHCVVGVRRFGSGGFALSGEEMIDSLVGGVTADSWESYKVMKGRRLAAYGYRVYATSISDHWMRVTVPPNGDYFAPRVSAEVKFFMEPSEFGIEKGRISKMTILTMKEAGVGGFRPGKTVFCYERGIAVNQLERNSKAKRLYFDLLRELN